MCIRDRGSIDPKIIVWAVGDKNFSQQGSYPTADWRPQAVYDLNYSQDSPGRACAGRLGCDYVDGYGMFREQALKQQEFWRRHAGK